MDKLNEKILFEHIKFSKNQVEVADELFNFLLTYINKKRLLHSMSVAELSYRVAIANKLPNPKKYYEIGLLHDIAKDVSSEKSYNLMDKYYKNDIDMPDFSYHQFLGELILMRDFGIFDKEILDAVKYHCSGNKEMDTYQKIVYACDKIDPRRGYDSKFMIDAMLDDYEKGFILVLNENLKFLKSKVKEDSSTLMNKYTKECVEYYL